MQGSVMLRSHTLPTRHFQYLPAHPNTHPYRGGGVFSTFCHVLETAELHKSEWFFQLFALGKGDDKLKIHRFSCTCTKIKATEVSCNDQHRLKE